MRRLLLILVALSFTLLANRVFADNKLGFISMERIMNESPPAVEIPKKLQKEFAARGEELTRLQKQIDEKAAALDKDSLTLAESELRNREQELSNSNLELQRKKRELAEDIDLRKGQEMSILQDRINKAVTAIAQAEGYDLVLYQNVAYASKAVDITDKVMKSIGN